MRGGIQVIGGLGVGLLIGVLLVAWRLASGPVSLGFLTPYMQGALDELHQGAFEVTFDDTILTWAGWERTLDIRIVNLRVALPAGGTVASVPQVSLSLSAEALLHGAIAPRSVEFFGPKLNIERQADGRLALGFAETGAGAGAGADQFASSMILAMLQEPDPTKAMSYLKRLNVVAGDFTYVDNALGTSWRAPAADADITRTDGGLKAELDLDIQAGDTLAAVAVVADYAPEAKRISVGLSFADIKPAVFAGLSNKVALLGALDLPLSGTVTLGVAQDGAIEDVSFELTGGEGALAVPVELASGLGQVEAAQRLDVLALEVAGRYAGAGDVLELTKFTVAARPGETVYLPQPVAHEMPLSRLDLALTYTGGVETGGADADGAGGRLEVSRFTADLGGPHVEGRARISGLGAKRADGLERGLSGEIAAQARDVPFDSLPQLWPQALGVEARAWVLAGLTKGMADQAEINVALAPAPDGGTAIASLAGRIHAQGVDVDYLPPMPRVTNAAATATFDANRFDIKIEGGDGPNGLKVTAGDIALMDLQQEVSPADITVEVSGPVSGALQLIDSEPLGFAKDLGIQADTAQGEVQAKVNIKFPLVIDLAAKDVRVEAEAKLAAAAIKGVVFERDLSQGDMTLKVSNDELSVAGKAQLGDVPVEMTWRHDFRDGALFLDRYDLSGYIGDVLNLNALGVNVPPILARYMTGGTQTNVSYTRFGSGGKGALSARLDLENIALSVPELGWNKPTGMPGTATLELRLEKNLPKEIPSFAVSAPDMEAAGAASFDAEGKVARVDLSRLRSGLTDVAGSITPAGDGAWEVVLRGESLDAGALWDEMTGVKDDGAPDQEEEEDDSDQLVVNAAVDIRSLIIREDRVMHDLVGTVYRERGLWRKLDVVGVVSDKATVEVLLDTARDGLRYLSIASNDAGSTLRILDLYDNILGGVIDLKAAYTRPGKKAPLEGVAKVNDYAMIKAPAFAKLIGIMSLTGVLDALQGDGLNFDVLEAPFVLHKGMLTLTQARASGPTIGVTANGLVRMKNRDMDLKGTVVPAYAINALLGKIPVIGQLFTGSEKGGGLFAASYTMRGVGEDAEISVNPLTALAPGVLRDIFTGSDKEGEVLGTPTPPAPQAAPAAPVTPAPAQ